MEGVELDFREDAALGGPQGHAAQDRGQRGLRTILENVLLDTMYDLPSLRNVQKVVVDEQVIEGHNKPCQRFIDRGGLRLVAPVEEQRRPTGSIICELGEPCEEPFKSPFLKPRVDLKLTGGSRMSFSSIAVRAQPKGHP